MSGGSHSETGHTCTDSEQVDGKEERRLCAPVSEQRLGSGADKENVGDTEDGDANANQLEATGLCVGEVSKEQRQSVGQHGEGLRDGVGLDGTHAERTSGLLSALRWSTVAIAANRHLAVNEVADQRLDSVVGGALAELDCADEVRNDGQRAGHTAEGCPLMLGGLAIVVLGGKTRSVSDFLRAGG